MRHTLQGERAQLLRGRSYLHYLRRTLPYLFKSPTESAATAAGRSSRRGLNKLLELHLSEMQLGRAKQPPPQQGDPKTPNPSRRFRRSSNEFLRKSDAQRVHSSEFYDLEMRLGNMQRWSWISAVPATTCHVSSLLPCWSSGVTKKGHCMA